MYAVIATGGKQYKVTKGETLRVEKLAGDEGSTVKLDNVGISGNPDARQGKRDRKNHGAWSWQKGGNHQIPSP
jgi:ribosomal protein L21